MGLVWRVGGMVRRWGFCFVCDRYECKRGFVVRVVDIRACVGLSCVWVA